MPCARATPQTVCDKITHTLEHTHFLLLFQMLFILAVLPLWSIFNEWSTHTGGDGSLFRHLVYNVGGTSEVSVGRAFQYYEWKKGKKTHSTSRADHETQN